MATIAYDGQTYKVFLVGKVAADGSVSGTGRTRVAGAGPIGHATGTEAAQGIINALYQPGNIHSELVFHLAVVNGSNEPKMQRRGEVLK